MSVKKIPFIANVLASRLQDKKSSGMEVFILLRSLIMEDFIFTQV